MDDTPEDKRHDSKYRRYVAAVEKCLQSFESVNEWADVISFLTRLGKVFQSFPAYDTIPYKLNLAKRLAQCLNPALPAGVHQKTLEIYEIIFRKIGNSNLAKDLSVYSFGLFPFFEHSATLVKSSLLELYEVYLLPLGVELRPSLRPLVLSILPGLEEESSEHFSKVYEVLNRIMAAAGAGEFYEALWTSLLISPRHRLAIVNFFLKSIPAGCGKEELTEVCIGNSKLVARALASALADRLQLVVRGTLDILLKHFPVTGGFFSEEELVDLFGGSMLVLMRKDMSLTRRFYSWILLTDPQTEQESLPDTSFRILTKSTKNLINCHDGSFDYAALPFKLLVFVLDKPILADPLIKACLFDLVNLLVVTCRGLQDESVRDKLLVTANNLFRMLELDVIWGQFASLVSKVDPQNSVQASSVIEAVSFAIMHLSVCDESSLMIHLHLTVSVILKLEITNFPPEIAADLLELCLLLLAKLSALPVDCASDEPSQDEELANLMDNLIIGNTLPTTLAPSTAHGLMKQNAQLILAKSDILVTFSIDVFSKASRIILILVQRMKLKREDLRLLGYQDWIEAVAHYIKEGLMESLECSLQQLADHSLFWAVGFYRPVRAALIENLLPRLWKAINSGESSLPVNAALLAKVCHIFPREADVSFAGLMAEAVRRHRGVEIENFASFWNHCLVGNLLLSVPLRLTLTVLTESLTGEEFKSRKCAYTWTFTLCQHLDRLLDPVLLTLADVIECGFSGSRISGIKLQESSQVASPVLSPSLLIRRQFKKTFDRSVVSYYLGLLTRLLNANPDGVMNFLQGHDVQPHVQSQWMAFEDSLRHDLQIELGGLGKRNYFNFLLVLMVPLLLLEESDTTDGGSIKADALQLMTLLAKSASADSSVILNVLISLSIDKLSAAVSSGPMEIEKQLVLLQFFSGLFSNELVAALFDREDIVALAELCRKALRGVVDGEVVQVWADFVISIAFLPRSDVELIPAIMLDSLYLRLTTGLSRNDVGMSEALLSSLILSVAKLTVFYFASRTLSLSNHSALKKSVSGLLSDTIQDVAANGFDIRSASSANLNLAAMESVLFAFLEVHQWLSAHFDAQSGWSQCLIVLGDTCRQFYLMNQSAFTHFLMSIFMKHVVSDKHYRFLAFFQLFFAGEGVEFLRAVWQYLKMSKDSVIKHHDSVIKVISVFALGDCDDGVNVELWNVLLSVLKEAVSSTYKYKHLYWTLLDNVGRLLVKLNRVDSARQNKDFDLLLRFFESCIVLAAKLNDPAQWTARFEEELDVHSDRFTTTLLDCVKDRSIGRCANSICQSLIPQLGKCFGDLEKMTQVMNLVIVNIVTPNFKSPLRSSLMGQISASCLQEAIKLNSTSLKPWRRELWEAFFDNSFLWMPRFYFSVMSEAFRLLTADPERYIEVLGRISASSTASMFLSKDAEMVNKALMIRRLSFLTFWGTFDSFRLQLPSLQEKLVELTKYYNGLVLGEIFFLIRVMLLRLNDETISSLWPLIMTELVQVFENSIRSDTLSGADLYALHQACKLIDLMLTLRTGSILMYHWLFFDGSGSGGLFVRLQEKLTTGAEAVMEDSLKDSISFSTSQQRRPLLSVSTVKSGAELIPFLRSAKTHMSNDFIMIQGVDSEYINVMMEIDLLESLG